MAGQRNAKGQFVPGNSAGVGKGRPVGARDRNGLMTMVDAFVEDLAENGTEFVKMLRVSDPATYANVVAKLIPRELVLTHLMPIREPEMTEVELYSRILAIAKQHDEKPKPLTH